MSEQATEPGTLRFADRFGKARAQGHFRRVGDLTISSLGIGTYLGAANDETDERYAAAIERAVRGGVNVIDTAINYRFQRSERAVRAALRKLAHSGDAQRDELLICTKGGFVPYDQEPPVDRVAFLEKTYRGLIAEGELVDGIHCMAPAFVRDQVRRSLDNLGLSAIDVYYLHNPELQRRHLREDAFYERLRAAFEALEQEVDEGRIRYYGTSTWNGYRTSSDQAEYLDLTKVVRAAREVGGDSHHLRFVQVPVNLMMREAASTPTQRIQGRRVPLLSCARSLGIQVVASASLMQGRLAQGLPGHIRQRLPGFDRDNLLSLNFVRSLEVATALVGMSRVEHVDDNLALLSYRSRRLGV